VSAACGSRADGAGANALGVCWLWMLARGGMVRAGAWRPGLRRRLGVLGGLSLTGADGVERGRGRLGFAVGLCAGLALAWGGLVPGAGLGAVYSVSSCADAAGQVLPVDGWAGSSTGESSVLNTCPGHGGLYVGMNQQGVAQAPGDFARWGFVAPADTSIASVRLQRDTAVSADPLGHWWYQSEFFGASDVSVGAVSG